MGFDGASTLQRRYPYPPEMNFPLHDERFRDDWFVVDYVGQTEAERLGLEGHGGQRQRVDPLQLSALSLRR